jgi:hypothetical protein
MIKYALILKSASREPVWRSPDDKDPQTEHQFFTAINQTFTLIKALS